MHPENGEKSGPGADCSKKTAFDFFFSCVKQRPILSTAYSANSVGMKIAYRT